MGSVGCSLRSLACDLVGPPRAAFVFCSWLDDSSDFDTLCYKATKNIGRLRNDWNAYIHFQTLCRIVDPQKDATNAHTLDRRKEVRVASQFLQDSVLVIRTARRWVSNR